MTSSPGPLRRFFHRLLMRVTDLSGDAPPPAQRPRESMTEKEQMQAAALDALDDNLGRNRRIRPLWGLGSDRHRPVRPREGHLEELRRKLEGVDRDPDGPDEGRGTPR